ncbi:MAG: preprotein translocase subunit SecE [Elusimicrobiota bacterium]|nr:preprotein translocase subunit SecE [Elusimicrobiota bacterium]
MIQKSVQFVKEAIEELKKVSWLGRKEVVASTIVIAILIIIVAIFIGAVDFILSKIIKWMLG